MKMLAQVRGRLAPLVRRPFFVWAAAVAVLVLAVPAYSFLSKGAPPASTPRPRTVAPADVLDFGWEYSVRTLFTLGYGEGRDQVAYYSHSLMNAPASLEMAAPAADGSVWIADHPVSGPKGARVRRLDRSGHVLAEFRTPIGSTLFTPGRDGDLWVDIASGGGDHETVVRYSATGKELARYPLPPKLFARALAITPAGECFALSEEWLIDPKTREGQYTSALVPVAIGLSLKPPADPRAQAIAASFFGDDGLAYRADATQTVGAGAGLPVFRVSSFDQSGTTHARYSLAPGLRPYAADASGRVYAESLPATDPLDTVGEGTIGDANGDSKDIWVYASDGSHSRVPVEVPAYFSTWAPSAWPTSDGHLVATSWEGPRLAVLDLGPAPSRPRRAAAAPPAPPELTLVSPQQPPSGDPYRAEDPSQRDIMQLLYLGLVTRDASGTAHAGIAKDVPSVGNGGIAADGRTITYTVRKGLRWHDGQPVTAEDVAATWRYLKGRAFEARPRPFPGFDRITSVKAAGDSVTVSLDTPYYAGAVAFFPYVLPGHLIEGKAAVANPALWASPVGCGPYRLERWEDGRSWQLRASDPSLTVQRLEVLFADGPAALDIFRTSTAPIVWQRIEDAQVSDVERDVPRSVASVQTGRWWGVLANLRDPYLRDPVIREAAWAAYPLRELYASVLPYGSPTATVDAFYPWSTAHRTRPRPVPATDVAKARRLLAEAGYTKTDSLGELTRNGAPLPMELALTRRDDNNEAPVEQGVMSADSFKAAGMKGERDVSKPLFYAPWWRGGALAFGDFQLAVGVFPAADDPGLGGVFDPADIPGPGNPRGMAVSGVRDSALAALYEEARGEPSAQRRGEIGRRITQRAEQLGLVSFERYELTYYATRNGVEGYRPGPWPAGGCWNVGQWRVDKAAGGR